jgi:hypothetical protein
VITAETDDGVRLLKQFGGCRFNLDDGFRDIKRVATNVTGIGYLQGLEWFGVVSGMKGGPQMA